MKVHNSKIIQIVCTANVCRSPMCEYIMRNELVDAGLNDWTVESRGMYAMEGYGADPGVILALMEWNLDARNHRSQQLTIDDVRNADLILTAELSHRETIREWIPESECKVQRLTYLEKGQEEDLWDPYGRGLLMIKACRDRIKIAIEPIIEHLRRFSVKD